MLKPMAAPVQINPWVSEPDAADELILRRAGRQFLQGYIKFISPSYVVSFFSETVCREIDQFIQDVKAGRRPILILQAPPQHGKSEIVSRKLPAFLLGAEPSWRIGTASYSTELANTMAQDVRRNLASPDHQALFPIAGGKRKYDVNRMGQFTAPGGTGGYVAVGIGSGLTGRPVDIGIIDDPIKDAQEALSEVTKEGQWNWYQSVFTTRLSEKSGQIIMATAWAEDDLAARIASLYANDPRLKILRFPAINTPNEVGYNPDLPAGALVPELHSIEKLREQKALMSDYWWSALYQQSPKAMGGNVFKEIGIKYYLPKDLPDKWDKVYDSWDCTFKDTDGTDFVVGQKWGKRGANSYLLFQKRGRMSFTTTVEAVCLLYDLEPHPQKVLIEDKANGPAVIDTIKKGPAEPDATGKVHSIPGLFPVEPDGSKLARAHAVTSYWEAGNIFLPHPDICPWVKELISELTAFDAGAHDDQVDALTQALRQLYPLFSRLKISSAVLKAAAIRR